MILSPEAPIETARTTSARRRAHSATELIRSPRPSPMLSLAVELISRVFFDVLEDVERHQTTSNLRKKRCTLSLVCRQWRNIVLECPSLWSNIVLEPSKGPIPADELCHLLSRARKYPLAITWQPGYDPTSRHHFYDPRSQVQPLYDLVKNHNWRNLHIDARFAQNTPAHCFKAFILHLSQGAITQNLTTFYLVTNYWQSTLTSSSDPEETNLIASAFEAAPALTDLTIPWNLLQPSHPIFGRLKWLGLAHGDRAQRLQISHILSIIRECHLLESLRIFRLETTSGNGKHLIPHQASFTLGFLRHIQFENSEPPEKLFITLLCPNLRTLDLTAVKPKGSRFTDTERTLGEILRYHGATLTRLSMQDVGITERAMLSTVLPNVSGLRFLHMAHMYRISDRILDNILRKSCPNLEEMYVKKCGISSIRAGEIVGAFITERCKGAKGEGIIAHTERNVSRWLSLRKLVWDEEDLLAPIMEIGH
ncbi:hypothetical protein FRB94_004527 [Tulasnella sp. JGI-2019a]|nr:hypothetical protein FRB94_004527 [Tulasnella sp. JGI-2019a]